MSRREDERHEKIIRGLLKLAENRKCINCDAPGPQYVCTTFGTFVCTGCSGIHREFAHRIKSVSMAKFTEEEVNALQNGGNARAREYYFRGYDLSRFGVPSSADPGRLRDFIRAVYVERRFTSLEPQSSAPPYTEPAAAPTPQPTQPPVAAPSPPQSAAAAPADTGASSSPQPPIAVTNQPVRHHSDVGPSTASAHPYQPTPSSSGRSFWKLGFRGSKQKQLEKQQREEQLRAQQQEQAQKQQISQDSQQPPQQQQQQAQAPGQVQSAPASQAPQSQLPPQNQQQPPPYRQPQAQQQQRYPQPQQYPQGNGQMEPPRSESPKKVTTGAAPVMGMIGSGRNSKFWGSKKDDKMRASAPMPYTGAGDPYKGRGHASAGDDRASYTSAERMTSSGQAGSGPPRQGPGPGHSEGALPHPYSGGQTSPLPSASVGSSSSVQPRHGEIPPTPESRPPGAAAQVPPAPAPTNLLDLFDSPVTAPQAAPTPAPPAGGLLDAFGGPVLAASAEAQPAQAAGVPAPVGQDIFDPFGAPASVPAAPSASQTAGQQPTQQPALQVQQSQGPPAADGFGAWASFGDTPKTAAPPALSSGVKDPFGAADPFGAPADPFGGPAASLPQAAPTTPFAPGADPFGPPPAAPGGFGAPQSGFPGLGGVPSAAQALPWATFGVGPAFAAGANAGVPGMPGAAPSIPGAQATGAPGPPTNDPNAPRSEIPEDFFANVAAQQPAPSNLPYLGGYAAPTPQPGQDPYAAAAIYGQMAAFGGDPNTYLQMQATGMPPGYPGAPHMEAPPAPVPKKKAARNPFAAEPEESSPAAPAQQDPAPPVPAQFAAAADLMSMDALGAALPPQPQQVQEGTTGSMLQEGAPQFPGQPAALPPSAFPCAVQPGAPAAAIAADPFGSGAGGPGVPANSPYAAFLAAGMASGGGVPQPGTHGAGVALGHGTPGVQGGQVQFPGAGFGPSGGGDPAGMVVTSNSSAPASSSAADPFGSLLALPAPQTAQAGASAVSTPVESNFLGL